MLQAVVLLSNATAVLGILGYGASTTFVEALLARLIPAMLNGCAVALKSMLGEACDVTNQARGMAYFTLGWGFGSIVGPLLGGILSEPCENYENFPLCGADQLFYTRQALHHLDMEPQAMQKPKPLTTTSIIMQSSHLSYFHLCSCNFCQCCEFHCRCHCP